MIFNQSQKQVDVPKKEAYVKSKTNIREMMTNDSDDEIYRTYAEYNHNQRNNWLLNTCICI